jgi:hypothetical protein
MGRGDGGKRFFSYGDTMRTRRNQSMVSKASELSRLGLAAVFVVPFCIGACAGRQYPVTEIERPESATALRTTESPSDVLQFDNQATVYVDVYLVGGQMQQRLGRVPPGMRAMLRIPSSTIDWTAQFVRVAVIPGSQMSAEAWRDPRATSAIAQPLSELLSQRWTFRQPDVGGAALQLQATRLTGAGR